MKDDKIYVLATGFYEKDASSTGGSSGFEWNPLIFVGTVTDTTNSAVSAASIEWEAGKSIKDTFPKAVQGEEEIIFFGGVGNGVVTKKGEIVFPILFDVKQSTGAASILYSNDNGATWKIGRKTEDKTYDSSVVEWKDGKLLLIDSSDKGYRGVFESGDLGSTWKESLVFSKVWGNQRSRTEYGNQGSAIKVPVGEKDMLLFAHPLSEKGGSSIDILQLWVSDGQRIVRVGIISEKGKEQQTGNSILAYVGEKLYITHEINPKGLLGSSSAHLEEWSKVIGLTPLPELFESAKATMRAWLELDTKYKAKGIPTDGLVGFLGNSKADKSVWGDTYKCVDATVNDGESVDGGFRFGGKAESGAQWPVQSQGQNQVYAFTEKQFIIAATVTIHTGSEDGQFALIGASLDSQGSNVLLGLGYTHENKWYAVSNGKTEMSTEETFVREREYHVALTFANGKASVYVDGVDITDGKIKIPGAAPISHFYMGGMGESSATKGSFCTVKNVMLFNRNLEQNEMFELTEVSKKNNFKEQTTTELPAVFSEERKSGSTTKPNKAA